MKNIQFVNDTNKILSVINSYKGHLKHGNCNYLIRSTLIRYKLNHFLMVSFFISLKYI